MNVPTQFQIPILLLVAVAAFALGRATSSDSTSSNSIAGDPVEAVRAALATPGSLDRAAVLAETLKSLEAKDFHAVGELYKDEINNLSELEIAPFIDAWTRVDADATFEDLAEWDTRQNTKQRMGLRLAMEALATRDPVAAIARFESFKETYEGQTITEIEGGLVAGMAASDPERLRTFLQEYGESPGVGLGVALGRVARHQGVETLIPWTETLISYYSDELLRAKIFRKSVRNVARRDPRRAAEWVASHAEDAFAVDGLTAVAEVWIIMEPSEAVAWLEQAEPQASRPRAFDAAYRRWARHDAEAAAAWIESVERNTDHDLAVLAHARRQMENRDLEGAVDVCVQIIEFETREKCLMGIGRGWIKRDRAAAMQWIEYTDHLEEEARDTLRAEALKAPKRRSGARAQGPNGMQ